MLPIKKYGQARWFCAGNGQLRVGNAVWGRVSVRASIEFNGYLLANLASKSCLQCPVLRKTTLAAVRPWDRCSPPRYRRRRFRRLQSIAASIFEKPSPPPPRSAAGHCRVRQKLLQRLRRLLSRLRFRRVLVEAPARPMDLEVAEAARSKRSASKATRTTMARRMVARTRTMEATEERPPQPPSRRRSVATTPPRKSRAPFAPQSCAGSHRRGLSHEVRRCLFPFPHAPDALGLVESWTEEQDGGCVHMFLWKSIARGLPGYHILGSSTLSEHGVVYSTFIRRRHAAGRIGALLQGCLFCVYSHGRLRRRFSIENPPPCPMPKPLSLPSV